MTATILAFPADRCRQPLSVIEAAERAAYDRAANDHAAYGWHGPSVCAIMTLAAEGACAATKAKAVAWLYRECNVVVR